MKKLYFLLAYLSISQISLAQSANKTTAILSRLIASAKSYRSNGQLVTYDSFKVSYTGDRGYDEQTQRWKCDTMLGWKFDKGNPVESYRSMHTFDGSNHITAAKRENKNNGQWMTEQLERFAYATSGMLDTSVFSKLVNSINWDSTKTINSYNGTGKSLGNIVQDWKFNSWQNTSRNRIILNAASEPDSIIFEQWDANINDWEPHTIYKYSYSNNKLAALTLYYAISNGTWKTGSQTELTYHTNGKVLTELYKTWNDATSSWNISGRKTYTYNSSNDAINSLNETYLSGNSWLNQYKSDFSYNNFGQVLVETQYVWKSGQWQADNQTRNYYETYFPASVKNTPIHGQFKLYPVPAGDIVNLQLNLNRPTTVNIAIVDMTGKVVKSVDLPMVSQYNGQIDVAALPTGTYTVRMSGTSEPVIQKISIIK